ncbi:MAG: hypothetical protein CUN55_11420 [Phototrophicales bacterium]|nr:MAG: hypothetical protein CUN55_11420 [Phototrophicales bacterium]
MMRLSALLCGLLALVVLIFPMPTQAQTTVPYIIRFDAAPTLDPLTIDDVESGLAKADLSWVVANLEPYELRVEQLILNDWEAVAFDAPLEATDERQITIASPLNFGPVTYRLAVVDADGNMLDQRIAIIPFAVEEAPPIIDFFQLADGTLQNGELRVRWGVSNRQPYTNVVFEQVLTESGEVISAEKPRSFAWVPSEGSGVVVPRVVDSSIHLSLRVVDVLDGNATLAQRDLILDNVDGEWVERVPEGGAAPVILSFSVTPNPAEREGTVTVSWEVQNADVVQVAQVTADGRYLRSSEEANLRGSRAFSLLPNDFYTARFFIYAGDREGNGVTDTLTIDVLCPYTFFVELETLEDLCPLQEARTFAAAYQLFERGEMLWRQDRGEIIVLFGDGTYAIYPDTYSEGETINYPAGIATPEPDSEQSLPIRGFGKVWANNPSVRNQLGFAIGTEVGYTMTGQDVADSLSPDGYSFSYFTMPDESVVELSPDGTWRKV